MTIIKKQQSFVQNNPRELHATNGALISELVLEASQKEQ